MLPPFYESGSPKNTHVFGFHWANLLNFNPKKNLNSLGAWVAYFRGEAERFGCMLSRSVEFSANQMRYVTAADLRVEGDVCRLNMTRATALMPSWQSRVVYISFKRDSLPSRCADGNLTLYEKHEKFYTYKLEFDSDNVEIKLG